MERAARETQAAGRITEGGIAGDSQCACVDCRTAGIAVRSGQDGYARADLAERARARYAAAEGKRIRSIEGQYRVVDHVARDAAARAAVADLQHARADRRTAGVDVGAGQRLNVPVPAFTSAPVPLMTPPKTGAGVVPARGQRAGTQRHVAAGRAAAGERTEADVEAVEIQRRARGVGKRHRRVVAEGACRPRAQRPAIDVGGALVGVESRTGSPCHRRSCAEFRRCPPMVLAWFRGAGALPPALTGAASV